MNWLKFLLIPLSISFFQTETCKQKLANTPEKKIMKEEVQDTKSESSQLVGNWVESGIDANNMVFKLPIRRGGFSSIIFNADNTIVDKGGVNCGFGHQLEGTFSINDTGSIVANYNKKTKYMGRDTDPETVEVTQKFKLEKVNENELILTRYDGMGGEKRIGFLKKEIWDSLEANNYPKNPEK